MNTSLRGAIYGLTAAAIWGGMYVVSDIVLAVIPPFTLLSIRLLMAAAILGIMLRRVPNARQPHGAERLRLFGVGFIGFGISVGAQFVGTDLSTAVNGTLVTSASPAFILIFAAILLREHLTLFRIIAVTLATIGVIVIIDPANANFGSQTFAGDMALAVAAITWGLYSVLVRRVSAQFDTLVVSFYAFIGGLFLTLPAAALELGSRSIGVIDGGVLLGILYLGIVSTAIAMWMWNRAFALIDASVASLFFFAQPLVGTLLSTLLLDQQMTSTLWVGTGFIVSGVLLSLVRLEKRNTLVTPAHATISDGQ
ncbi:MAG: DMT family transporter [bacterium]|nr:DMT family transporter [bacterium]